MRSARSFTLRVTALVAVAALAACSGEETAAPTTEATTTVAPSTTAEATTTTAAVTTTTEPATTTTEVPPPVFALTGLEAPDAMITLRPSVVAKVGNYDAHPPSGLNAADIVFEEIINDNVSRFAVAFQSNLPADPVGPIRSGRMQDVDLLGGLRSPILAWSGGNGTVTNAIANSDLVNLNPNHCAGSCFRVNFDKAPFNLYFDISGAVSVGGPMGAGIPQQQFGYLAAGQVSPGAPSAGVNLSMDSYDVEWTWNAATGLYERRQNGRDHKERSGEVITTNNVVVLTMVYVPGISNSPDAQSVGSGEAWVFTGGTMVHGTWSRGDRTAPFTLVADDGSPILLTPGRSFVELPRANGGNVSPK